MTFSIYCASIPVFKQMLGGLSQVLIKAEAHARKNKFDPDILLQARIFPDMFSLLRQVQSACDFATNVSAKLANVTAVSFENNESSFPELQARISASLKFIDGLNPEQIVGSESREILVQAGTPREKRFDGQSYLMNYGMPNFFFHITAAYCILRHDGVEIGKRDYIGTY